MPVALHKNQTDIYTVYQTQDTTVSYAGCWNAFGRIPIDHLFDALDVKEAGNRTMASGSQLEPFTAM